MSELSATRNTCFALISSIEEDFRDLILTTAEAYGEQNDILPSDVRENACRRRMADLRGDSIGASNGSVGDSDLLPYIDFADISKIIDRKLSGWLVSENEWLSATSKQLLTLTPARNRVCHTRPLEPEDLANTLDLAKRLTALDAPISLPKVANAISRLQSNPSYVLALQIPQFWSAGMRKVHNNLPLPEFDETGFLGRQVDRTHVNKLLRSHYPVITIVGEGGIGKTALALRCLYDLLDDERSEFDAIVWVSMKTSTLTQAGIRELTGAVKSTLGLFSEIATQLGGGISDDLSEAELIDEIAQYLDLYRVIVAIDNLETISTGGLRALLERVPAKSKVLLTSRVGVGEFEARYPLQGMDEKSTIALLRNYSRLLGVKELTRANEGNLKGYCRALFHNPLLVKWFVASVGRGGDPARLLSISGAEFSKAIAFCFENLFDRFGPQEKKVIHCLASARRPLTVAEIHFLTPDLNDIDAEIALGALHNSSVVTRDRGREQALEYALSDSSVKFIAEKFRPSAEFFKTVQNRMRDLRRIYTNETKREVVNEFHPYFVRVGVTKDEIITAAYLRAALDSLREGDYELARQSAAEAVRLTPNSSEAWRISALNEENAQEFYRASEFYEQSVGMDAKSKIALYCYGMFLLVRMDDPDGALEKFEAAEKLDPGAVPILTAKAMTLTRLGRLDEASAIHENLLPSIASNVRRWRITIADQAADCYCRMAQLSLEAMDFELGKRHLNKAIDILHDASSRSDIDEKLIQRIAKVANTAFSKQQLFGDIAFSSEIALKLEQFYVNSGSSTIRLVFGKELLNAVGEEVAALRTRLSALSRSLESRLVSTAAEASNPTFVSESVGDRMFGTIHNVADSGRYAFITCSATGERFFTHAEFMLQKEDWSKCCADTGVSFRIGSNAKGRCAVDVLLIPGARFDERKGGLKGKAVVG